MDRPDRRAARLVRVQLLGDVGWPPDGAQEHQPAQARLALDMQIDGQKLVP
jgi:hypothetical protein